MKKHIIFTIAAAIIALLTTSSALAQAKDDGLVAKPGNKAPDFVVEMFDGSKIQLSDLRGKVVVLNFWATWCPPCRAEMKRVSKEILHRFDGLDFVFLPISRGETREEVEKFRESSGHRFPMGLDPDETIFNLYATQSIPRNFVIDREGRVVAAEVGYTEELFEELIEIIQKELSKNE